MTVDSAVDAVDASASSSKKRKTSTPPDGYVCSLCQVPGHWIQLCPDNKKRKKKPSTHIPVPGVDPSQEDIAKAREYQKIPPPNCFCGKVSRLKKVKKSKVNPQSRAVGQYFFFCASPKKDAPCRFARPVSEVLKESKRKGKKKKTKSKNQEETKSPLPQEQADQESEDPDDSIETSKAASTLPNKESKDGPNQDSSGSSDSSSEDE